MFGQVSLINLIIRHMDRLVGPVNLQVMARFVRRIADLPDDVVKLIHEKLKQWTNSIYMNHLRWVRREGFYWAFREDARTDHPFRYHSGVTGEYYGSLYLDIPSHHRWYFPNPRRAYRETGTLPYPWRDLLAAGESSGGPQWQHGEFPWTDDEGNHNQTQVRAILQPRYYGPGF